MGLEHIAELALRAVEIAGLVLLAILGRRQGKVIADRVSGVGFELQRVRTVVASSLRPPALTLVCDQCGHAQHKHTPRIERDGSGHRVSEENEGPCVAPFCCCPGWQRPAEPGEVAGDDTPLLGRR
jgi:hypothetical protein